MPVETPETPARAIVDTNVLLVADGAHPGAPPACVARCALALQRVMTEVGHVFLDSNGLILNEYGNKTNAGQPGPGAAFLKWLYNNHANPARCTKVAITRASDDPNVADDFTELAALAAQPPNSRPSIDVSDRKFIAVAAASSEHPPVLQAVDSKWVGWVSALAACGVVVHLLCPEHITKIHAGKMKAKKGAARRRGLLR